MSGNISNFRSFIEILLPGQKFAMLEMKIVISKLLRNFEIILPPGYEPELLAGLVLKPANGMMLELRTRKATD